MTDGGSRIGTLESPSSIDPDRLAGRIEDAGASAHVVDPGARFAADLDAAIVAGPAALRKVAHERPSVPVLPVAVDCGLPSVAAEDVEAAIGQVASGEATVASAPLLAITADGESATAFREVTAITAEPARISEFAIEHGGVGHLDTVRADGVVVATPAGSGGYAAAGDGPLLGPGTGLAVVPVAPFRTDRDRWVVSLDRCSIRVQRDEAAVTVEVDGAVLATVGRDATITVEPTQKLGVLVVEESTRRRP